MVLLSGVLSVALRGHVVSVELKNGIVVSGKLLELDEEHGNLLLDGITAAVRSDTLADDGVTVVATTVGPAPPHLAHVQQLKVRGSAVRHIDFDPTGINMDALSRASLME
jgi:small nuclear ribonucleoprotein (snRNP)-like protein